MGKKAVKTKRFLKQHPLCCFCGGATPATTQDHIPSRSFFLDSRHPAGMEFPACANCNNQTSNEEDIARVLAMLQGAAFNPDMHSDFLSRTDKYQKTAKLAGIQMTPTGEIIDSLELYKLGERESESFITLTLKFILAMHYKLLGKIATADQVISMIFYTPDRNREKVVEFINSMPGTPVDDSFKEDKVSNQLNYRYIDIKNHYGKPHLDGKELIVGFHYHLGLVGLGTVYLNRNYLQKHDSIVRSPLAAA